MHNAFIEKGLNPTSSNSKSVKELTTSGTQENLLQAIYQGYVAAGNMGYFIGYEGFMPIISSMITQAVGFANYVYLLAVISVSLGVNSFSLHPPSKVNKTHNIYRIKIMYFYFHKKSNKKAPKIGALNIIFPILDRSEYGIINWYLFPKWLWLHHVSSNL